MVSPLGGQLFQVVDGKEQYNLNSSFKLYNINPHPQHYTIIKNTSITLMTSNQPIKNYYQILGVNQNASLFDIQSAYEKLAAKWHPDKNKEHRKSAETKFQEIAQAYDVLSDRNKRANYDELLTREYNLQDANSTFERFFNEHGPQGQQEQEFFKNNYPDSLQNYYSVLGVNSNASIEEIKEAYRRLALQYHPKNNPGKQEASKKFIAVNQAYNALNNEMRRRDYDQLMFGTMVPLRAHKIFDDFFGNRWSTIEDQDFKPLFQNRWIKNLDDLMIDEGDERDIKDGQSIKTSSVYKNKNGQESKKTVTTKKNFKGGKVQEERIEEYLFPSGDRNVRRSITTDGKTDTKEYKLKKGQQLPKELTV